MISWLEKLKEKNKIDKATNIKIIINNKKNDIENLKESKFKFKFKRVNKCEFKCNCGQEHIKVIRQIVEKSGFFCKKCTNEIKLQKQIKTNLKKYGTEYASQVDDIKNKKMETRNTNNIKKLKDNKNDLIKNFTQNLKEDYAFWRWKNNKNITPKKLQKKRCELMLITTAFYYYLENNGKRIPRPGAIDIWIRE